MEDEDEFAGDKPRGKIPLADMPHWPVWLTKEEAAAFLGVSVRTLDGELADGVWPPGVSRGERGGRLSWHRPTLERLSEAGLIPGRYRPRAVV